MRSAPGGSPAPAPSPPIVIDFVRRVAARLKGIRLLSVAASLAFTTLLALVPLATVTFAVVAHFPVFADGVNVFEEWVVRVLLPGLGQGVVRNSIVGFAEQAARLTGLTLAFVALTALLLVATIENEINLIFGLRRRRPVARRVPVYVLGITLGPILVGASISVTTWLLVRSLDVVPEGVTLVSLAGPYMPWLITAIGLTLVYKIVPYTPVRWIHAMAGGMLGAVAFEALKSGFAAYVLHVPTYRQVYGALAVLPLFMLWVYLCWIVVLVGAALVSALTPGSRRAVEG